MHIHEFFVYADCPHHIGVRKPIFKKEFHTHFTKWGKSDIKRKKGLYHLLKDDLPYLARAVFANSTEWPHWDWFHEALSPVIQSILSAAFSAWITASINVFAKMSAFNYFLFIYFFF